MYAFFCKKYSLLLHLEYKSQPVDYVEDEKQNWEGDQKELVNPKIKELQGVFYIPASVNQLKHDQFSEKYQPCAHHCIQEGWRQQ